MTPLLDIEAAAEYLNISPRSVADHIRAGQIRHARIGKHIRIRTEWLDEYIATCEQSVVTIPIQRGRRRARL
jgi:excisionase family DNA binding protein